MSRIFLAAVFAAGLAVPGGAQATVQGFSIELGTSGDPLTLDYNPSGGLSAEAAAANGQPAMPLANNGSYLATITGDYAVLDDLPPVNESILWHESYEITLNGHILFYQPGQIVGPFSGEDIWQAFLHVFNQLTGLPPGAINLVIAVLENNDHFSVGMGEFDYAYNTLNEPDGAFAIGTTADLGSRIALNVGKNALSFDFSLIAVPEPSTWAMLLLGFFGLGVRRLSSNAEGEAAGDVKPEGEDSRRVDCISNVSCRRSWRAGRGFAPNSRLGRSPRPVLVEEVID